MAVLALTATTALTAGAAADEPSRPSPGEDVTDVSGVTTEADAATEALAEVRSIFRRQADTRARSAATATRTGGPADATMALRDLARYAEDLPADERAEARAYLARPTTGEGDFGGMVRYTVGEAAPVCSPDICIHYVASTDDAPSPTDVKDAAGTDGANGVPDYVDQVLRVMTSVHDRYLGAGYREPRGDGALGTGTDLIDIYLAEIGTAGLYGYCTTDQPDPAADAQQFFDRWAYCTLDNDYTGFPRTPLQNLQVTAAHEYFHATQYAYDAYEDSWFLEATATWAEDELYDDVNDNVQYLKRSPLTAPFVPLDAFVGGGDFGGFHYGTWTFFRFLTEQYTAQKGGMPTLVLDMMKKVDGSLGAKDLYSWQAVDAVLKQRRTTAAKQFLTYSVANRRPGQTYDEGAAQKYPTGPLRGRATLTRTRSRLRPATIRMDHLTSATIRLTPKGLGKKSTRLRVVLDMAPRSRGSLAAVAVVPKKGKVKTSTVKLSKRGDGKKAVRFSSRTVKYVEITLANSSARFSDCFQQYTPFSCLGIPRDDNVKQKIGARILR